MMDKGYLIIVYTYNVENKLAEFLGSLNKDKGNCFFINDCSTDRTEDLLKKEKLYYKSLDSHKGVSAAFKEGLEYALKKKFKNAVLMYADCRQHDPKYLQEFVDALKTSEVVLGNRFSGHMGMTAEKVAANMFVSALFKEKYGVDFGDISCGFNAFRLDKKFVAYITAGTGDDISYRIVKYVCDNNLTWDSVPISAFYYPENFFSIETEELKSLLSVLAESQSLPNDQHDIFKSKLDDMNTEIGIKTNYYSITADGKPFEFFFCDNEDSYMIKTVFTQTDHIIKERNIEPEYLMLRQEIESLLKRQETYFLASVTILSILLGMDITGWDYKICVLVSIVVLFLQMNILKSRNSIYRIASYMRVFLEVESNQFQWETRLYELRGHFYKSVFHEKLLDKVWGVVDRFAKIIHQFINVSLVAFLLLKMIDLIPYKQNSKGYWGIVIVSIVILALNIIYCIRITQDNDLPKKYEHIWKILKKREEER